MDASFYDYHFFSRLFPDFNHTLIEDQLIEIMALLIHGNSRLKEYPGFWIEYDPSFKIQAELPKKVVLNQEEKISKGEIHYRLIKGFMRRNNPGPETEAKLELIRSGEGSTLYDEKERPKDASKIISNNN